MAKKKKKKSSSKSRPKLKAKTKLVNGKRVSIATGKEYTGRESSSSRDRDEDRRDDRDDDRGDDKKRYYFKTSDGLTHGVDAESQSEAERKMREIAKDDGSKIISSHGTIFPGRSEDRDEAGDEFADDREDVEFDKLIDQSDLPDDIKQIARATFSAISTNDLDYAKRLVEGIGQAAKFADPYFKAQTRLVIDALERGFQETESDLEFNEQRLSRQLEDLKKDTQEGLENLGIEEQQELASLERELTETLDATREEMAMTGFTSSSKRVKKEQLTQDVYGDLRETKTRNFAIKRRGLRDELTREQRDTALEAERLRELAREGKLKLLREAEEKAGSDALKGIDLGGLAPLRGITGSLQNERAKEIADLASSFVF